MIHIINGQNDELMDIISDREVLFNSHKQSLENQLEQFDFECLPNLSYADKLTDRNRLIIPSEDEGYIEFIIQNVIKTNDRIEVYTTASYLDLIKAKVIYPTTLTNYTATAALSFVTNQTEWRPGTVESDALRTITIETHTNPFAMLKRVANEFDLELRFRTETNGNRVTNRYVDLLDRVGTWDGREVTFGKDLDTIERSEDTSDIYTALLCLGPEDADGNRLEVLVEDEDALQRWGRPDPITGDLKHLIGVYEPQSERLDMTLSELEQYGRTELNKRINAVITYSANIVDLEHVPGMENKKIRFGDTIRIKDEKFIPPLYVEARVFEQSRDIFENSLKEVKLGDFVEFTEEQVLAIWKSLQEQIKEKISQSQLFELTYDKPTIDGKDTQVKTDAEQDATQKAQQAISVSKDHADQVASDAESNANNYTNTVKSQIDAELLDKAGLEYVNGQLVLKADSALVNTINNTVADLETTASNLQQAVIDNADALNAQGGRITTVETDLNTVEGQLSVAITDLSSLEGTVSGQGTQISANTSAIDLKANQSELDTVSGNVSDLNGELNVLAGQVELKASQSALTNLANDVTQISSDVSSLQVGVDGITADVSSLESTVNGHTSDISSLNSQVNILAGQISLKADATTVDSMDTRLSNAEIDINALDGAITSKVETSTFNTLKGRVDTAETTISQQANEIDLKVNKNGVIGAINLSSEVASINASKINLIGAVTVLSDITGNLGTINAGTINGVNINGSAFNQTGANGSITLDDNGLIFDGANSSIEMNVITTSGFEGDVASLVFKDNNGFRAMEIYQHFTDSVLRSDRALHVISGDQGLYLDGTAYRNAFNSPGVFADGGLKVINDRQSLIVESKSTATNAYDPVNIVTPHATTQIGPRNSEFSHFRTSASSGFYFYDPVTLANDLNANADVVARGEYRGAVNTSNPIRWLGGGSISYLQTRSTEYRITDYMSGTLKPIRASSFPLGSSIEYKDNIKNLSSYDAERILDNCDIFSYHLKSDLEMRIYDKIKVGALSEMMPKEIRDENGADVYSMVSVLWKIAKDQKNKVIQLEQRISDLEMVV